MQNYTSKNLLALFIFYLLVWGLSSFVSGMIVTNLETTDSLKKELSLKQSFTNQKSTEQLSKSINDFVPDKLDKVVTTNYVNQLAKDSSVKINSIDIKEVSNKSNIKNVTDDSISKSNNKSKDENIDAKSNTFKKSELTIKLSGNKQSLDKFLERLVASKQYIDIFNINFDFQQKSNISGGQEISLNIAANIYYKNL